MNEDLQRIELIERYVNGELEGKELTAFEERLKKDASLRQEVVVFKDVTLGAEVTGRKELEAEINRTHQELKDEGFFQKTEPNKSKIIDMKNKTNLDNGKQNIRSILVIAATIALLLTAGYFIFNQATPDNPSNEELFTKIYKPEESILRIIIDDLSSAGMAAADDPQADSLATGLKLYETHQYEEARSYLASYIERYPKDHKGRMYLGLSLLQQSEYAKASRHLQTVSQVDGFAFKSVVDWYLAQCYLMYDTPKGKEFAKKLFQKVANDPDSPYQKEAAFARDMLN